MTATGTLTIDLDAVAHNYRFFVDRVGAGCSVAGVVKANAYGLGADRVVPLLTRLGCRRFYVATLEEAVAIKPLTPSMVGVLGGLLHGAEAEYRRNDIFPVLNSLEEIARWRNATAAENRIVPVTLHFDTGMNRLGLGKDEGQHLLKHRELLDGLDVRLVMSHFACADEVDHPMTAHQAQIFETIAQHFPGARKSLANSSGIMRNPAYHHNVVRPGMAVYGLNPIPEKKNPMRPAVQLHTRLLQVRKAGRGETVGYGASHRLERGTRVGTVALGYADGFLRSGGGRAMLYHKGRPCPVIGRVSMDLVTVDLGKWDAEPGDAIEILGPNQDADKLADALGTIGYEVLTGLGRRWNRIYVEPTDMQEFQAA